MLEDVYGAAISRQLWNIQTTSSTELLITSISGRPDVSLCVRPAIEPRDKVNICVRDAAGEAITCLTVKVSVGTANPKPNENDLSSERNIERVSRMRAIVNDIAHIIQRK
jgi:hypothetical protein